MSIKEKATIVQPDFIPLLSRSIIDILQSDRGSQYASYQFREVLEKKGFIQSMSRKGNCWDNTVAESFFHTLKS